MNRKRILIAIFAVIILIAFVIFLPSQTVGSPLHPGVAMLNQGRPANEISFTGSFNPAPEAPDGFVLAASNGHLSLYFRESDFSMAVRDNIAGALWLSYMPMEEYIGPPLNDLLIREVGSLFRMEFTDLGTNPERSTTANLLELRPQVITTLIPYGFQFDFIFSDLNLRFAIDFELNGNRLHVTVPPCRLIEGYGAIEQMERHLPALRDFVDFMQGIYNTTRTDPDLPSAYIRNINNLGAEIRQFENILGQIDGPDTISEAADRMLSSMRRMRELTSSGDPATLGIFNRIRMSDSLPADVTGRYNRIFLDVNNRYDMVEMSVSILRNVRVTGLVELILLPFFGSAGDGADGYMVYPDGSGARTFFRESQTRFAGSYRMDVFGSDAITPTNEIIGLTGQQQIMLPIIGVVKNGAGFAAIISDGSEGGIVHFRPSGFIYNINRVYFGFRYRRQVATPGQMGVFTPGNVWRFEAERQDLRPSVTYIFLPPDEASYSGMANAIRQYMLQTGKLQPSPLAGIPSAAIDMMGGFNNRQLIFDNFISLTSYYQASYIIRDLSMYLTGQLLINYTDWNDGRNTTAGPISAFGGTRNFRNLFETASSVNARLFIEMNTHDILRTRDRVADRDLAISNTHLIFGGTTDVSWLAPTIMHTRFLRQLSDLAGFGVQGITLTGAGNLLYFDYHPTRPASRMDMIHYWQSALLNIRELSNGQGFAATRGGNAYVLSVADWLKDIPHSATGFMFTDESIPLFHMIVHGSILYTGKPVNIFHDPPAEILRMMELGYVPLFSITYNEPDFRAGFSSVYANVRNMIISLSNEISAAMAPVAGQHIVRHERTGQITTVEYANGYRLILNYSNIPIYIDGHEIPDLGYVMLDMQNEIFAVGSFRR